MRPTFLFLLPVLFGARAGVQSTNSKPASLPEVQRPAIYVSSSSALIPSGAVHSRPAAGFEPKIVLETNDYDFGGVEAGKIATREITFKNEGKGPLRILQLRPMCGCILGAVYLHDQLYNLSDEIAPGAVGMLRLSLRPLWGKGDKHTRVDLLTNDPTFGPTSEAPFGHIQIKITARIQPTVEFIESSGAELPEAKVAFGAFNSGTPRRAEFTIRSTRDEPFEIAGIVPADPHLLITSVPVGASPSLQWKVNIEVPKGEAFGPFTKRFQVVTKPEMYGIQFYVEGEVCGKIQCDPALPGGLNIGAISPSTKVAGKIVVSTLSKTDKLNLHDLQFEEFKDYKLEGGRYVPATKGAPRKFDENGNSGLVAEIREIEAGRKAEISIMIKPGPHVGLGRVLAMITVHTSIEDGPEKLVIPLSAVIR
ncbi:MAG: DUF1573 domain-containing protein [Planctomycetes bacterium]|nr:DUF1573 domain-containing protein [Planctomycetota bacterium]